MLILPTKKKWFCMILYGIKLEEYRDLKPYYRSRFQTIGLLGASGLPTANKVNVMFRNGYSRNAPSFIANVSLDIKTGREEWGAEPGKKYYTLHIHEVDKCKDCLCQKCDNDVCEWCRCQKCNNYTYELCQLCRCQKNNMEMECYTNDCNYYFNEQEDIDEGLLDFGPGWSSGVEFERCEKPESEE